MKYRQVEILVTCSGHVNGKDVALFSGWLEKVKMEDNIRMIFATGEKEVMQWIGWLCLWRELDGNVQATEHLSDEETEVNSTFGAALIQIGRNIPQEDTERV